MAADTKISNAAAIAACNAIVDLVDADASAGQMVIYDVGNGIPTECDANVDGSTALVVFTLDATEAFGNAADGTPGGVATLDNNPVISATASASGTAAFFRILDGAGDTATGSQCIIQGTCGTSNADMVLNTTSIISGATINITSHTVTVSEG